jgi:NAD(P)-dependent dehydrogenase (short-subunit alcohol dehydrogenase family)
MQMGLAGEQARRYSEMQGKVAMVTGGASGIRVAGGSEHCLARKVANAVLLPCSNAVSAMMGSLLVIDGGFLS